MTAEEFDALMEKHPEISWAPARINSKGIVELGGPSEGMAFRMEGKGIPYYDENEDSCTFIDADTFRNMKPDDLMPALIKGLDVEWVTRVTGYFTKVSMWNKGKRGELKDRYRNEPCGTKIPESDSLKNMANAVAALTRAVHAMQATLGEVARGMEVLRAKG